jgi:multicomponent Na+:H+ antiporter subunit C
VSANLTLSVVVGGLFAVGVYLLLDRTLTRVVFGLLLLGHATNLLLLLSGGPAGDPPIVGRFQRPSDPLAQSFVLTAIVITLAVQTLLLTVAYRSWQLTGEDEVQDDVEDRLVARRQAQAGHELEDSLEQQADREENRTGAAR